MLRRSDDPSPDVRPEDADPWFVNLEDVANRVTANEKKASTTARQQRVVVGFVLLAFFALAYRSEVNADRISDGNRQLRLTQFTNCESGRRILTNFNSQQDELIAIESQNVLIDPALRARRIQAYRNAKIAPLPNCEVLRQ